MSSPAIAPAFTYDALLAAGYWTGREAELRRLAAQYTVDGTRLGGILFETISHSINDPRLVPKRAEIEAVSYVFARLGYVNVGLRTLDSQGSELERPDVDVTVDGDHWGVEVAVAIDPAVAKSEAEQLRIESAIRDLIESDSVFSRAFGSGHLAVRLESDPQPLGRSGATKIISELIHFITSRDHCKQNDDCSFGAAYTTLRSRGASFTVSRDAGPPYFSATRAGLSVDRSGKAAIVLKTLNDHRGKAATYRHLRNWCVIQIIDLFDLFRPTLPELAALRPPISPFAKVFVRSPTAEILVFEQHGGVVSVGEVRF